MPKAPDSPPTAAILVVVLRMTREPYRGRAPRARPSSVSAQTQGLEAQVEAGTSGFLSSSDMDLGVPMEFQQGTQALSCVETWNSVSLSQKLQLPQQALTRKGQRLCHRQDRPGLGVLRTGGGIAGQPWHCRPRGQKSGLAASELQSRARHAVGTGYSTLLLPLHTQLR